MASTQIAAQLYTLRDYLKTPADIAQTLKKVAGLGYRSVQLSALGPIETNALKRILDDNGLSVCATHVNFNELRDELDRVVDEHRTLGCKYVAIGGLPQEYRN